MRLLTLALALAVPVAGAAQRTPRPPNVVVVVADDLGWADTGAYGGTAIRTPNLDRLAAGGLRFTDAYAASPVCSPSRAALQTGLHPARIGMYDVLNPHRRPWARLVPPPNRSELPPDAPTLAEALAPAGYTSALVGKWNVSVDGAPTDRGYVAAPTDAAGLDPAYGPALRAWVQANPHKGTGPITVGAVRFMEAHRADPFLLVVSYYAPHIRSEARPDLVAATRQRLAGAPYPDPAYAAMVEVMDEGLGWVVGALDALGLADDTVVLFTSDNGGLVQVYHHGGPIVTTNGPLRGEKGTLYEGGVRVPLVARGPGVAAGTTTAVPVTTADLFATVLDLAGAPAAPTDGLSLAPLLRGGAAPDRDALFWHYPAYHHDTPASSVRVGRWKLVEHYETGAAELYDLDADPGERRDLAADLPLVALGLRDRLARWRGDVGASLPTPNPDYDPTLAPVWGRRPARPDDPPPPGALDMGEELRKLFE